MALYNKYRPKYFKEVVGQTIAKKILTNNILNIPFHAFIFYGSRGTGKTSLARIFARGILCENFNFNKDICNSCDNCILTSSPSSSEILEIAASSYRGINEMKEIFNFSAFLPVSGMKKIIIFDESHMLTQEAFGFLLKNIEECFQHVIYIFVTTEINKLPVTIISRCQKVPFYPLSESELLSFAKSIIYKEKIEISDDFLLSLVKKTKCIPREFLVLLEEIGSYDENDLNKIINFETIQNFSLLYEMIKNGDKKSISTFVDKKFLDGIDWKNFIISFLDFLSEQESDEIDKFICKFYRHFVLLDDLFFSRSFVLFLFYSVLND